MEVMLANQEIDETKYKVLKGFVRHINFVFAEPSEGDRQAVAKAYCDYYKCESTARTRKGHSKHSPGGQGGYAR